MARRVRFTEEQMQYIMECNGISPDMLQEDGATTCASVGAETTRGDIGYDAPAFNAKKNDKFWKDSMTHNKKGGISCERLKEGIDEGMGQWQVQGNNSQSQFRNDAASRNAWNTNYGDINSRHNSLEEDLDEDWKSAAVGLGLGAASLMGGGNGKAQAAPAPSYDSQAKEITMRSPVKYSEEELIQMFPYAYHDRGVKDPGIWKRNQMKYEGYLPLQQAINNKTKKLSIVGREAAKNGQNPWDAICHAYLDTHAGKTLAGQF